ncbi:MAG: Tex family protein [Candidatus Aminicenantaceae bacterium]
MDNSHLKRIAAELDLDERQVRAAAELLAADCTVPFIARYRKEATGGLDEVAVLVVRDLLEKLAALDKRRKAILKSMEEQGVLTAELQARLRAADSLSELEDIYLPFRPKRRTRGSQAIDRGLEPLARQIFAQEDLDPMKAAISFVDPEKDIPNAEEALAGARDIIAEWINEDAEARAELRDLFSRKAVIRSHPAKGKGEVETAKFKDYLDWQEPLRRIPSHRLLAMLRGKKEGLLSVAIQPEEDEALRILERRFVHSRNLTSDQVRAAAGDGYRRLLSPSLANELLSAAKQEADVDAIRVFADNLREMLLASPLGSKNVLALDPGFRTGCKVVCLDRQGRLLESDTIYPLEPQKRREEAAARIRDLALEFDIEAVAVGNGTGGREAFAFCRGLELGPQISVILVNESGASVYSASVAAREEFPDQDVTVRGSVSIGRRLMDPLSELVKIDPKSIGVGQYQHDVDQKLLKQALDDTVMSCVSAVGVEVNMASIQLLSYVPGLGPRLAAALVEYRDRQGSFLSRQALLDVSGLGPKAFEQAAGFLRIRESAEPLDASAVHPESYPVVERIAADLGQSVEELMRDPKVRGRIELDRYVSDAVGLPTLNDILDELTKPGRDPRREFEAVSFAEGINEPEDLKPGMQLPGVVTNVTNFGAFVDVGVHQDGLVHISQLADRFVAKPSDVVKVGQKVSVRVLEVDLERRRIALSMRQGER